MGRARSREPAWTFLPAAILVLLLLGATQLVEAMTPAHRPPIPRPSEQIDALRIEERLLALKMYRMVREAESRQEEIDRHRLVEEVVNLGPQPETPALRVLTSRRE